MSRKLANIDVFLSSQSDFDLLRHKRSPTAKPDPNPIAARPPKTNPAPGLNNIFTDNPTAGPAVFAANRPAAIAVSGQPCFDGFPPADLLLLDGHRCEIGEPMAGIA